MVLIRSKVKNALSKRFFTRTVALLICRSFLSHMWASYWSSNPWKNFIISIVRKLALKRPLIRWRKKVFLRVSMKLESWSAIDRKNLNKTEICYEGLNSVIKEFGDVCTWQKEHRGNGTLMIVKRTKNEQRTQKWILSLDRMQQERGAIRNSQ